MLYIKALSIGKVAINLTETKLGKRQLSTKIKKPILINAVTNTLI